MLLIPKTKSSRLLRPFSWLQNVTQFRLIPISVVVVCTLYVIQRQRLETNTFNSTEKVWKRQNLSNRLLPAKYLNRCSPLPEFRLPSDAQAFHMPSCATDPKTKITIVTGCRSLINGDQTAVSRWATYSGYSHEELLKMTSGDCSLLKQRIHFPTKPMTREEEDFPLAYGMVVYKNPEQVIRQLSAFYWPQNLYCITYDLKSSASFERIIRNLAENCFNNVIIPEKQYRMEWCSKGQLLATKSCVESLNARKDHPWKYFQYLSGSDLPLRTNYEMVQIMKLLNGSSDSVIRAVPHHDYSKNWTNIPGNLTPLKGSMSVTFSRATAEAILKDKIANEYFEYLLKTNETKYIEDMCPDEAYWTTVLYNDPIIKLPQKSPGQLCIKQLKSNHLNTKKRKSDISRYQTWLEDVAMWNINGKKWKVATNCHGKYFRYSCVFGIGDLPILVKKPHLIAHKVYLDYQPAAFFCMNEWLTNRTYNQPKFDLSFYKRLVDVRYAQASEEEREKIECFA